MDISSDDSSVLLSSTLTPTNGFHTTSATRITLRGSRARSCALHLYFTLPVQLFADPYELAHRRASYTFERFGGGNLEAPVFTPGAGGPSGLLLDLAIPEGVGGDDGGVLSVDVPLHARYGVPKQRGAGELIDEVVLPPPEAFWVCPEQQQASTSSGEKRVQVPDALHDVVELAPTLKDAASTLVLIPRAESVRAQTLRVPVGDASDVALVETGTVVAIVLAFVYLLRTVARASRVRCVAVKGVSVAKKES
ncbi:PIG-X [Russula compacta]|nr:PIG-X [Russula compacta]